MYSATDILKLIFLGFLAFKCANGVECPNNKPVICYWASWSIYRPSTGYHDVKFMEPEHCTHIVYTFAGMNLNGVIDSLNYYNDITNDGYKKILDIKTKHPCIKILLAVGGWNEGSEKYSLMVEKEESRSIFIDSALRYVTYFGFDGIDIDWEYPGARGGITEDKENFVLFLQELKERLVKRNKILTAAIPAAKLAIDVGYDIEEICEWLDYVSIMAYDMHNADLTSAHSPLKHESRDNPRMSTIDAIVQYMIKNKCSSEKIILGIPAYGRSYILKNANVNGIGAGVAGPGHAGPFTQESGFLGFNEICYNITETMFKWKVTHLEKNAVKYAACDKSWVTYDDPDTVKQKVNYVKDMGLAGVMFWSIDTDDFHGGCYSQSYPLLKTASAALGNKLL